MRDRVDSCKGVKLKWNLSKASSREESWFHGERFVGMDVNWNEQ